MILNTKANHSFLYTLSPHSSKPHFGNWTLPVIRDTSKITRQFCRITVSVLKSILRYPQTDYHWRKGRKLLKLNGYEFMGCLWEFAVLYLTKPRNAPFEIWQIYHKMMCIISYGHNNVYLYISSKCPLGDFSNTWVKFFNPLYFLWHQLFKFSEN